MNNTDFHKHFKMSFLLIYLNIYTCTCNILMPNWAKTCVRLALNGKCLGFFQRKVFIHLSPIRLYFRPDSLFLDTIAQFPLVYYMIGCIRRWVSQWVSEWDSEWMSQWVRCHWTSTWLAVSDGVYMKWLQCMLFV